MTMNNWPLYTEKTLSIIKEVFDSNRFTISGYWTGKKSKEEEFSEKFAAYNNVPYCVPVTSCSTALMIALEALDIGFEDEVIVPALTWLATATSVLNVNAFPVIIDIDPETYCMDVKRIEENITEKTKAIIPVHLYGCMADMDEIIRIAEKYNIKIIEDCAQTPGSIWNGKKAGTIGDIGAFSFEQSKILSSGEGGCCLTKDPLIYEKLSQLRLDSRVFNTKELKYGELALKEKGTIQGSNYKLTEIQSAILLEQLEGLNELNIMREKNARYLDENIGKIPGFNIMKRHPQVAHQTYFSYCIKVDSDYYGCKNNMQLLFLREKILKNIKANLDIPNYFIHPSYPPVNTSKMFCPWTKKRFPKTISINEHYWRNLDLPAAAKAVRESIAFHHSILLYDNKNLDKIINTLKKITMKIKVK